MQLVKLITPKKINTLRTAFVTFLVIMLAAVSPVSAQDNSPYSRYGIGDIVPNTNIVTRGLGGISAGYTDPFTINFNNPASYSSFQAGREKKSKKLYSGRAVLDIGVNIENRTLKEPNNTEKFTASNALFSYVQVGVPLRQNWGLTFGLRPVSRISYKILTAQRLVSPVAPFNSIDSAVTQYEGDGGSYLASIGTGFSVLKREKFNMEEKLSIGINGGYLFGEKDYSTRRAFANDTVEYYKANYETRANYGNLYFNTGLQYMLPLKKNLMLTVGAFGNWGQTLNARQDLLRETYEFDENSGYFRIDSVYQENEVKGKIEMPSSFTTGIVVQKYIDADTKKGGWMLGIDFVRTNWDNYRYYNQTDAVRSTSEVRAGVQINPFPKKNYFSNISYRFGFFTGTDYVFAGQKLNQTGGTFGLGLPLRNYSRLTQQATIINLSLEYIKRGNNNNLLSENLFRISAGFSLSDIWFGKRKYE
jgi:hypothetical protein